MDKKTDNHKIQMSAPELNRGPLWLRNRRKTSGETFNDVPLPPRGLHLWRYTDPAKFLVDHSSVIDTVYKENYDAIEKTALEHLDDEHLISLVTDLGGREINIHGLDNISKKGITVTSLSDAVEKYHSLVEPYLYELVNSRSGKFEAMNGALWNDGIFIYVPPGITVEKPIHLLREAGLENSAQYPRLLIVVDRNSELTIIDEYGGGSDNYEKGTSNANAVVEVYGRENSRTRYVNLQRYDSAMNLYLTHRAKIEKDASMLTIVLSLGALLSKQNFGVILNGDNAESNMYGLIFGSRHQHFDCHTLHHHAASQTRSNIDHKVVLRGKAQSAYTGLIKIEKDAKTCEAYQENRNLLLNRGTKAETIPELEILNDDVMCSHGATIGPIDPMDMFYLNSRGIDNEEALKILVSGFVQSTLNLVPSDLRDRIGTYIEQRLEKI